MNSKHFQTSKIILFLKCKYFFQKINKQLIYIVCQLQHRKGISSFKFYFLCEFKEGFYAQERERERIPFHVVFLFMLWINYIIHVNLPVNLRWMSLEGVNCIGHFYAISFSQRKELCIWRYRKTVRKGKNNSPLRIYDFSYKKKSTIPATKGTKAI